MTAPSVRVLQGDCRERMADTPYSGISMAWPLPAVMPSHRDEEWLRKAYLEDGLSTYRIAAIVGHDPKTVYSALVRFGIPRRRLGGGAKHKTPQPYQNAVWLRREYVDAKRSSGDIAKAADTTQSNILFFLKKFGIPRRTVSEARAIKHWGLQGSTNGMYGKMGRLNPNYKDSFSPERQRIYAGSKWKALEQLVFKRDRGACRRCGKSHLGPRSLHAHHVAPWAGNPNLRFDPDNIITLCSGCHRWVHSRKNTAKEYVAGGE